MYYKSIYPIGMMLGRLSPLIDNRIQTFPIGGWEQELKICSDLRIGLIEWTIDTYTFFQNPLLSRSGIDEINSQLKKNKIEVPSVTCDYYMENPHWVKNNIDIESILIKIIEGMYRIGSRILVIPLVDNASIALNPEMDLSFFLNLKKTLLQKGVHIAFETDLDTIQSRDFIQLFDPVCYGINYDIGNSASMGYSPKEEFSMYGHRILNVHVKDRILNGNTVPLGLGNADFKTVVAQIKKIDFQGNFIMQTARASNDDHKSELMRNIEFFERALNEY